MARECVEHISTERVFEACEGADMVPEELTHVRACTECLDVLSLVTRYKRLRFQKLASGSIAHHVPLVELWLYGRGSKIDDTYRMHLIDCEFCMGSLGLCRDASALREVMQALKRSAMRIE